MTARKIRKNLETKISRYGIDTEQYSMEKLNLPGLLWSTGFL